MARRLAAVATVAGLLIAAQTAAAARTQHVRAVFRLTAPARVRVGVQAPCVSVRVTLRLHGHGMTVRRLARGTRLDVPLPGEVAAGRHVVRVVARATGRVRCPALIRVAQPAAQGVVPAPAPVGSPVPAPPAGEPAPAATPAAAATPLPPPVASPTASPAPTPPPVCQPTPPVTSGRKIPLGTAVSTDLLPDSGYRSAFLSRFDTLTPENELKMDVVRPAADHWNFAPADSLFKLAGDNGKAVRGHTLVFARQLPAWLTSRAWTRDELRTYLRDYIATVVGRYKNCAVDWDVVNEPTADGGGPRSSLWQSVIGDDYVADAFRWAHAADPAAKLFLNDYYTEVPGAKADSQYALVAGLVAAGVPIDGVGFELHSDTAGHDATFTQIAGQMQRYADLGLDVEVTEMDVSERYASGATLEDVDRQAATVFDHAADACNNQPRCLRFGVWGVGDSSSWIGAQYRPLLLDSGFLPKPAWYDVDARLR